jgi:hypothetical protein
LAHHLARADGFHLVSRLTGWGAFDARWLPTGRRSAGGWVPAVPSAQIPLALGTKPDAGRDLIEAARVEELVGVERFRAHMQPLLNRLAGPIVGGLKVEKPHRLSPFMLANACATTNGTAQSIAIRSMARVAALAARAARRRDAR